MVIRLNSTGDLYREPKESFFYPMTKQGVPLKILRYFANNPNTEYESDTAETAAGIGMSADQLRKEINKMRSPIKDALKLKVPIIEGRKGSGYRLNPNIEIVLEN